MGWVGGGMGIPGAFGGRGMGPGQRLRSGADGWDEEEYGSVYNHRVVMRLLRYLRPFRGRVMLAVIGMIGFIGMREFQPLLIGFMVDAAADGDMSAVNRYGLIFLVLALGSGGFYYLQLLNTGWVGHRVLFTLRTQMFNHLQKLSLSFYDKNEVGRVMSRLTSDVTTLQELLASGFIMILADFLGLFLVVYIIMGRDVEMALLTLAVVPFLLVAMFIWQSYARRAFMRVRQAIAVVNANLQENVSGVRVTQSLSREEESGRKFESINRANLQANIGAGRITAAVMPMVELAAAVATASVVIYGGFKVLDGEMEIGLLITFALYVQRFYEPVRTLVLQYTQLQRAMAGGERIFEVLDTVPEIQDVEDAIVLEDVRGEVTFENVTHEYVEGV
ncbi:MAG: ABC transporter ATP-binding protein, partial [Chloroflexi bacterium]|nr:ABC transporter ATP-binding protein [Chloroflexota bacterium]